MSSRVVGLVVPKRRQEKRRGRYNIGADEYVDEMSRREGKAELKGLGLRFLPRS